MTAPVASMSLPVIDLSLANTHRDTLAKTLVDALDRYGFVSLENVPGFDPDKLLEVTKNFFNQSDDAKLKITKKPFNPDSEHSYRGYFPALTSDKDASYKDGFDFGRNLAPDDPDLESTILYEHTPWPEGEDAEKKFKEPLMTYFDAMDRCGLELLRLISLGLGVDENVFDTQFERNPLSTLRLLHYPPRPRHHKPPPSARDGDYLLHCGDHTDSGFITILATFNYAGLQVYVDKERNGQWVDIAIKPTSLVMNIGEVLEALTGHRIKATRHRVIDLGVDRYSVPYFMEPRFDAELEPLFGDGPGMLDIYDINEEAMTESKDGKTRYLCYGPWLIKRMEKLYVEFQNISNFPVKKNTLK